MGKRSKQKIEGRFLALPFIVLDSPAYLNLNHAARSLLLDIARQYSGSNNGKLVCCTKYLKPRGWTSNDTIRRGLSALIDSGFIVQTRQGGKNSASWFALTWHVYDYSAAMDLPREQFVRGAFRAAVPAPIVGLRLSQTAPTIGLSGLQ
jgi:hypothetical protein